jgi:hypothetical protein
MSKTEDRYRVVFAGNLTGDLSLERTKIRFRKVFRLMPASRVLALSCQTDVYWSVGMQKISKPWPQKSTSLTLRLAPNHSTTTSLMNNSIENVDGY